VIGVRFSKKKTMKSNQNSNEDRAVVEVIRQMSQDADLRLSTDDRMTPRFNALIRVGYPESGAKRIGTSFVVVRDQGRVGILCVSDDGLPFSAS